MFKKNLGDWLLIGGLILITVLIYRSVLFGLPQTHDGQLQVARITQYYLAINQGQWPPRIAPNANFGFGYPVFNFNYPLPYILGTALIKAQLPIEMAMKTMILAAMILGGLGMYWLLNRYVSKKAAFLGAVLYATSNYALLLVFVRGGSGEIWAYALLPWLLWIFDRFIAASGKNYFGWSCLAGGLLGIFLLAHNIMALFGSVMLMVFLSYKAIKNKQLNYRVWQPLVIGFGLAAFFWIPAMAEQKYTIIKGTPLSSFYQEHFPTLKQLIYDAWGYGYSRSGPVDGISFNINPAWLMILGWGLILIWLKKKPSWVIWLYVLMGIWTFMILPVSLNLWKILPFINYIQFPWRLLFFWPILAVPVIAWVFDQTKKYWLVWGVLVVALCLGILSKNQAYETFSHPDEYWFHFNSTTSLLDENMPIWFIKEVNYPLDKTRFESQPVSVIDSAAEVKLSEWTGSRRKYTVTNPEPAKVVERIAYFPGLEVKVNGQKVPVDYQNREFPGLVTYQLPAGTNSVESKMTQNTLPRLIGNGISLITLIVMAIGLGWWIKKRK